MKRSLILFIYLYIVVPSYAQITIHHNGSLKSLISVLQSRYGYKFMYSNDDIQDNRNVTINVRNTDLETVMKEVSRNMNISYEIKRDQVILKKSGVQERSHPAREEIPAVPDKHPVFDPDTGRQPIGTSPLLDPETREEKMKAIGSYPTGTFSVPHTKIQIHPEKQADVVMNTSHYDNPEVVRRKEKSSPKSGINLYTNLLYDLILTPNIGVEYVFNETWGFLLNGMWSHIDWKNGYKTYRIWTVNPEIRFYIPADKRFYTGGLFQLGELNLKLDETGYQGDFIGGGLQAGYQMNWGKSVKLDFNLGLGYTCFDYDSYNLIDGINIRKDSGHKNLWGPVRIGIIFIWKMI